jgi:hypothetical protein
MPKNITTLLKNLRMGGNGIYIYPNWQRELDVLVADQRQIYVCIRHTRCSALHFSICSSTNSYTYNIKFVYYVKLVLVYRDGNLKITTLNNYSKKSFNTDKYRIPEGQPEGKRPMGRRRRRGVDNIKMDLREIGWDGMDWIDLAQDRDHRRAHVNTIMNHRVP